MSDLSTSWQKILHDAISQPGVIHDAYTRFHNYSVVTGIIASDISGRGDLHSIVVGDR